MKTSPDNPFSTPTQVISPARTANETKQEMQIDLKIITKYKNKKLSIKEKQKPIKFVAEG